MDFNMRPEESMEQVQSLAEEVIHNSHVPFLGLLCGDLSPQVVWKMMYLSQHLQSVEERCTLLNILTDYIVNTPSLLEEDSKIYKLHSPRNMIQTLSDCWSILLPQAIDELSDESFVNFKGILINSSLTLEKYSLHHDLDSVVIPQQNDDATSPVQSRRPVFPNNASIPLRKLTKFRSTRNLSSSAKPQKTSTTTSTLPMPASSTASATYGPASVTSARPTSVTTARPASATSTRPASVTSTRPASATSSRPASVTSTKPASVTSTRPAFAASSRPASVTSARPASVTSARPASVTSTRPASVTSARPASVTSTRPASATSSRPASVTSTRPASATSSRPASVTSTKPTSVTSTRPASAASARPASVTSSRPASVTSARPASVTTARPASVTSARPASVTCTRPASATSTRPASVTSTRPASATSSRPASVTSARPASAASARPASAASSRPALTERHVPTVTAKQLPSSNTTQPQSPNTPTAIDRSSLVANTSNARSVSPSARRLILAELERLHLVRSSPAMPIFSRSPKTSATSTVKPAATEQDVDDLRKSVHSKSMKSSLHPKMTSVTRELYFNP